jgi:twitching motility protein PilU
MDLSFNLRGIISQRLISGVDGKRVPAVEIMLNTSYIAELIRKGEINEIKSAMKDTHQKGIQPFDQSLYALYSAGKITKEETLANADSRTDLEWRINFGGEARPAAGASFSSEPTPMLSSKKLGP